MDKLDKIIKESVDRFLIREFYHGDLYHFTTLASAYWILESGEIHKQNDDTNDSRVDDYVDRSFVSLSRTKNIKIGYADTFENPVAFVVNGDRLMGGKIRNGKLFPFDYNYGSMDDFEFEERFYGNIPLSFVEKVIIYAHDLSEIEYRDEQDMVYDDMYDENGEQIIGTSDFHEQLIEKIAELAKMNDIQCEIVR